MKKILTALLILCCVALVAAKSGVETTTFYNANGVIVGRANSKGDCTIYSNADGVIIGKATSNGDIVEYPIASKFLTLEIEL